MLPAFVAGAIVVVGWLVAERFSRSREQRADLRSAVAGLAGTIDEVTQAAVAFYRLPGNDAQSMSLAATIKARIATLSDQLAILKTCGLSIDADELLKRFRQSITGGDFESTARNALPADSPAFAKMANDGQALNRAIQTAMLRHLLKAEPPKP
ncbi:hypothetical protein [Novosphingobium sp.]|uniref:hypothetical protein n=1 Tax=Novosphingobium sp. TaxID=1874826 RepID=UPI002606D705|nr:hypothetical protein [Novosphingobium sp.]